MPYKYQGLGAGPTTPRMWVELVATLAGALMVYGAVYWLILTVV